MNYGEIERHTLKTFLAFSTVLFGLILVLSTVTSRFYRVSDVDYDYNPELNMSSLESLVGKSIWLVNDADFELFYEENPTVEVITKEVQLPDKLLFKIVISEKLAYIEDKRQSPPRTFLLYKNLYAPDSQNKEGLMTIKINNGPVRDGFLEELVSLVMTLKKYSLNLANIEATYDGESMRLTHFDMVFDLGLPSDLGRKGSVVGLYISEQTCTGEISIVYSGDGKEVKAVHTCN